MDRIKILINKIIWCRIAKLINRLLYMNYFVIGGGREEHSLTIDKTAAIAWNSLLNLNGWNIIIKPYAMISQNVSLITWTHDYTKFWMERMCSLYPKNTEWYMFKWDIIIEEWAWLCNNVTIIWPCIIGKNSVVAAWSVVTKNVPDYVIVWWNPAKIIKKIPIK